MIDDRRRDPRTDPHASLHNLLRVRAEVHDLALALLSTADGVLVAGSRQDRPAQRAAAHAADVLRGEPTRFARDARRTGGRLSGLRLEVDGRPLILSVLEERPAGEAEALLTSLAERVSAILAELRLRAAA